MTLRVGSNRKGAEILKNKEITYILTRKTTQKQTGFFSALPDKELTLDDALALLIDRPQDDFLRQYVLAQINDLAPKPLQQLLDRLDTHDSPVYRALTCEYLFLTKGREFVKKRLSADAVRELIRHTSLIYLRSLLEPDQALHGRWTAFFRANMQKHTPLSPPNETGLPPLTFETPPPKTVVTISDLAPSFPEPSSSSTTATIPPGQTADIAEDRLEKAGVELGELMRHESSLSPIGLLRTWRFNTMISSRRNRFLLSGEQTSYGRGLSLDTARASLMMEIVERYSAFASVSENGLENYQNNYPLRYASLSELTKNKTENITAVNPAKLALEVSYQDAPLHWVCGEMPDPTHNKGHRPVWVPVQFLFMFCNLDEPALYSGLGSTGLASGSTLAQAKKAALLEIVERHQAATVPYNLSTCFQLVVHDPGIAALLEAYRQARIHLWFQDITPPNGVPCCRCFAVEKTGEIHIGAAAHLDARRAIISAITETTCPFPDAPPTMPEPEGLTLVGYENLPNFTTGDDAADLALLESLFIQNSLQPCYVDLTRADVRLPVVKAIVPGTEILGDFDDYSRVHPELYRNYLKLHQIHDRHPSVIR